MPRRCAAALACQAAQPPQVFLCVLAEGVDDTATAEMLRQFGVDYAQGHLYAEPAPVD
jgi:FOG: EAL domain